MNKSKITKTHLAILENAVKASDSPLELKINVHSDSTYVEISYGDEYIIANGHVGRKERYKTSSEIVTDMLGDIMFWAYRGKRVYHERCELQASSREDSTAHL